MSLQWRRLYTDYLMTILNYKQHAYTIPRGASDNLERDKKKNPRNIIQPESASLCSLVETINRTSSSGVERLEPGRLLLEQPARLCPSRRTRSRPPRATGFLRPEVVVDQRVPDRGRPRDSCSEAPSKPSRANTSRAASRIVDGVEPAAVRGLGGDAAFARTWGPAYRHAALCGGRSGTRNPSSRPSASPSRRAASVAIGGAARPAARDVAVGPHEMAPASSVPRTAAHRPLPSTSRPASPRRRRRRSWRRRVRGRCRGRCCVPRPPRPGRPIPSARLKRPGAAASRVDTRVPSRVTHACGRRDPGRVVGR